MNKAAVSAEPSRLRLAEIERARRTVMEEGRALSDVLAAGGEERGWIERSWRRCLQEGRRPEERVSFDVIPTQELRRVEEANHALIAAARPVLGQLGEALASTRYFAVLTNHRGIVVDTGGRIDRSDPRVDAISRIGVDLSERVVGTSAVGAALAELRPLWLHRGEHFFEIASCYSCAGAPVFDPDGRCAGMLDLTAVDAAERPELKHLAEQSVRSIENALAMARPHNLVLRLNWPGRAFGGDDDGLICLDGDGQVTGSNGAARQMVPGLAATLAGPVHCSELIAQAWEPLFHAGRGAQKPVELCLWSGLRLSCLPQVGDEVRATPRARMPLREVEIAFIRKAVRDARGNVMEAARALGISRATVYRKLSLKHPADA